MAEEKDPNGISAENVLRLSPREIFEDLLGEPSERGYDEETLKEVYEKSRHFACDRINSWKHPGDESGEHTSPQADCDKPIEK